MAFDICKSENCEIISVTLSETKTPIAFNKKVKELVNYGMDEEKARTEVEGMEIELEIFYEEDYGLFAVESDAVDCTDIYSPYTAEIGVKEEDE